METIEQVIEKADIELMDKLEQSVQNIEVTDEVRKRAEQLKAAGFINAPEIKAIKKVAKMNTPNPMLEIVKTIKKVCKGIRIVDMDIMVGVAKKYGLAYGTPEVYKLSLPQKNMEELLDFKKRVKKAGIQESDLGIMIMAPKDHFDQELMKKKNLVFNEETGEIEDDDPIIFCKIAVKGSFCAIVITAWGKEARIPEIFPEINN